MGSKGQQPTTTSTAPKMDTKKWEAIYPCYLNSKKSLAEGRRVPKEFCVEDPSMQSIFEVLKTLGLPFELQLHKTHPKDFGVPGRVKVRFLNDDKKPFNPEITTKGQLLKRIGKAIPTVGDAGDQSKKGKKGKKP